MKTLNSIESHEGEKIQVNNKTIDTRYSDAQSISIINCGNECNQSCKQCFYQENNDKKKLKINDQISIIEKIKNKNPNTKIFLFPKEATTSPQLFSEYKKINQLYLLSNGKKVNPRFIEKMKEANIKKIKITLFGSIDDQNYFNKNTEEEYNQIQRNIRNCTNEGINVLVYNVLSSRSMVNIDQLCKKAVNLGVKRIDFLKLLPVNSSRTTEKDLLTQEDMLTCVIPSIEEMRKRYKDKIHLSLSLLFGPNFYKKTLEEAKRKISGPSEYWSQSGNFLCDAINHKNSFLSLKSNNSYFCQLLMSHPEISKVAKLDPETGKISPDNPIDLRVETLREKLDGLCSKDNCEYQSLCLGACRASAYLASDKKDPKEKIYSGMDMCLTDLYSKM